jgi:hypothetical protein
MYRPSSDLEEGRSINTKQVTVMNKKILCLCLFVSTIMNMSVNAQNRMLFDTMLVSKTSKFIGRIPQYEKNARYQALSFCIEDSISIMNVLRKVSIGKEVSNIIDNSGFYLTIINNYKEEALVIVYPGIGTIMIDGHSYEFDANQIKDLAVRFPFNYKFKRLQFSSKEDFSKYLDNQMKDSLFLFSYNPNFRFEGTFDLEFKKSQSLSSPKAVSEFITPKILGIVDEKSFNLFYELSEKNLNNPNQFTMTISGSKKLYENLNISDAKKFEWKPAVEEAWFFYRQY